MNNFKIVIDFNSFNYNSNIKMVTGVIFVSIEEIKFPEDDWNDFPIGILNLWGNSIINNCAEVKLFFMDGPFFIRVEKKDYSEIELDFMERGKKEKKIFTSHTTYQNLVNSLIDCIEKVIQFCDNKQWEANDLAQLKNTYKLLVNKFMTS